MYKCDTIADCMNGRYKLQGAGRFRRNGFAFFHRQSISLLFPPRQYRSPRFPAKVAETRRNLADEMRLAGSGIGEGIAPVLGESEGFGLHDGVLTAGDLYIQDKRYPVCINEGMLRDRVRITAQRDRDVPNGFCCWVMCCVLTQLQIAEYFYKNHLFP